jgi:hypothetical protein
MAWFQGSPGQQGFAIMSEVIDLRALFNVFLCYTLLHTIAMVGWSGKRHAHKVILLIREREPFDQKTGAVNATREDHSS